MARRNKKPAPAASLTPAPAMTMFLPMPTWEVEVETWHPIPGLGHYEASTFGRIRSRGRTLHHKGRWAASARRSIKGRILHLKPRGNYLTVNIARGRTISVSRSVCSAFRGPAPSPLHEAAHLDGNTFNNRPRNLIWATPLENAEHKRLHGTIAAGERNGSAKLTTADVVAIRAAANSGEHLRSIAKRFGVQYGTVQRITSGEGWTCVP